MKLNFVVLLFFVEALNGVRSKISCNGTEELESCMSGIYHLIPEEKSLPYTTKQVNAYCLSFDKGMRCVDRFTSECMNQAQKDAFEYNMNLHPQRAFMDFLCKDPTFRYSAIDCSPKLITNSWWQYSNGKRKYQLAELDLHHKTNLAKSRKCVIKWILKSREKTYFSHKKCLQMISNDWYMCDDRLNILQEYQKKHQNGEFELANVCCLKEIFSQCIYVASKKKCDAKAANFLRKVTATLLYGDNHNKECHYYTMEVCANGQSGQSYKMSLYIINLWTFISILVMRFI